MERNKDDMLANASKIVEQLEKEEGNSDLFWIFNCLLLLANPKHFDSEIEKLKLDQAEMRGKLEIIENLLTR